MSRSRLDNRPSTTGRVEHLDALRGLVIVLMTLDHVRDFVQPAGANPMDFESSTWGFFLMRWVTHLCAPTFVWLMGIGASLRHQSRPEETGTYLLSRGVWLMVLEATWVSFCWSWDPTRTHLGVLWALGGSMVGLALVHRLPRWSVFCVGLGLVALFNGVPTPDAAPTWLFRPGPWTLAGHTSWVSYPILPWFGLAAMGWGIAPWAATAPTRQWLGLGAGLLAMGITLRWMQLGDPRMWSLVERGPFWTVASWLHVTKYPPSLVFQLLMIGSASWLLAVLQHESAFTAWLARLGRVPMFFYLIHLPVAHLAGNIVAWSWVGQPQFPADSPTRLWLILLVWACVLCVLTPICGRWLQLKREHRGIWWLSYV